MPKTSLMIKLTACHRSSWRKSLTPSLQHTTVTSSRRLFSSCASQSWLCINILSMCCLTPWRWQLWGPDARNTLMLLARPTNNEEILVILRAIQKDLPKADTGRNTTGMDSSNALPNRRTQDTSSQNPNLWRLPIIAKPPV